VLFQRWKDALSGRKARETSAQERARIASFFEEAGKLQRSNLSI
jgi:hypothetical protein